MMGLATPERHGSHRYREQELVVALARCRLTASAGKWVVPREDTSRPCDEGFLFS